MGMPAADEDDVLLLRCFLRDDGAGSRAATAGWLISGWPQLGSHAASRRREARRAVRQSLRAAGRNREQVLAQYADLDPADLHSCRTSPCRPWRRRPSLLPHFIVLTLLGLLKCGKREGRRGEWRRRQGRLVEALADPGHAALRSCHTSPC
eukprot:scaffold72242_cov60-Phaeocystis_antarctica.AAC.3